MASPSAPSQSALKDNWSSDVYSTNASFVYSSGYTSPVLSLLAAEPGESILDLGCGSGEVTLQVHSSVTSDQSVTSGKVLGVDYSQDLLAKARSSSEDRRRLDWAWCDGHELVEMPGVEGEFDAVFSSAALHWMKKDPLRVAQGAYGALKTGGRFVGECGGHLNMIGVRSALHAALRSRGHDAIARDPWYFPTPEAYTKVLQAAGFRVESCELVPRITPLPTGLEGWLHTFGFAFVEGLSEKERQEVFEEVVERCRVDLEHKGGWTCMYVRLRFKAWKE